MARIAVVGAGMGAMAAAARLATGGHQVVVFERSGTYGGGVGRHERDGFAFDTGPGLLTLPAVYRDLFVKTGRESLEQTVELVRADPAARHLFPDGTDVSLPNASRSGVIEALDAAFGAGSGERWSEVMVRARQVWEVTRRPLLEDTFGPAARELARDPYPAAVRRGLFRRGAPTLAEVGARELRDPRLAALLACHALGYGFDPRSAPASAAVLPYVEQTFGVWYVRGGGLRALARAVYERCLARRVEFRFGAAVARVLERDGRVSGLELADGTGWEADVVVAGAPVPSLPAAGPPEPGRFGVHLALRGGRPEDAVHRTVVHARTPEAGLDWLFGEPPGAPPQDAAALTVTVLRPDDPALRPDDAHEAVTLTATVPPHGAVDWDGPGVADAFAELLVSAAEAAVPGLRERELWRAARSPADTERETGAPGGGVPRPALAGAGGSFLRPANRTPLDGLYFVGGWTHPGGGLPHAGMSGAIAADLVMGGPGGSR
ncbi:NAD(P)/FAD-dependent oxidoreductase [Streptomyces sp. HPF1205]|uniref:phytoene desaturase family protein n=1 Tax=Streptomyces sp. HPF1205 TaxID=2873262 RepID=UPI001CED8821|nr:NAD(P)/FAD-dependent oxidoreductase [Streptomyces sp. HPF1205]